jgi:glycosyltransferase involved in cell wall biosynthesis
MRVAHVSSFDISGGAGRAAYRLHRGLLNAGVDSVMVAGSKTSADPTVQLVPPGRNVFAKLRRRLRYGRTTGTIRAHAASIAKGHDVFSSDRIPGATRVADRLLDCDIIQLHWISWFVDWEDFFSALPPAIPIVWTLHDMNTFTGGCHYNAGCSRYATGCGSCPALDSASPDDLSSRIFRRKAAIFESLSPKRLHVVTPSPWLADAAKGSLLLKKFPCTVIPYGLDIEVFKPIDRTACRQVLDIPVDAKVVLFVADSNENKRKGFSLLLEALERVSDIPGLALLSIGGAARTSIGSVPCFSLGQLQNDRFIAAAYSAADVMVIPSLQDNLPNTVLEAMACGTPSVGFDVGGIPAMIRPVETGFLAPPGDVPALAAAIRLAISDANRGNMSLTCRQRAVTEYDLAIQAQRYLELYQSMAALSAQKDL